MRCTILLIFLFLHTSAFATRIIISDRYEFEDPRFFAQEQAKKLVVFTDASHEIKELSEKEWRSHIRGKNVAVLIHGYNNHYEKAIKCFSLISDQYQDLYDTHIYYLWPGGNRFWDYTKAKSQIKESELSLRFFSLLQELSSQASHFDVFAHSMGCRFVLETLLLPSSIRVSNFFLLAPAIGREAFDEEGPYRQAAHNCRNIYVFFSQNDSILKWGYPIYEWNHSLGAWGSHHPETLPSNVFMIDASDYIFTHKDYIQSQFVYEKIVDTVHFPFWWERWYQELCRYLESIACCYED